jgi:hypothetical protein
MKASTFLMVKAAISLLFGIGFFLIPGVLMALYGAPLDPAGALMGRLVGALLIGIGLICWLFREGGVQNLKIITLSLFAADTLGFLGCLLGEISGVMNALGWLNVLLFLLLALGLGYLRFLQPGGPK